VTLEDEEWDNRHEPGFNFEAYLARKLVKSHEIDIADLLEKYTSLAKNQAYWFKQYTELKDALVGDSPNWTHDEVLERALELVDLGSE
jgi:hypothetical protein|tara:strand:- start:1325 stop:1588 length:264 start_codon:yes stop_codon:yes gene_type:complete